MTTLPLWFQVLIGIAGILAFLGGMAAFILVIWPSIRRQNRLGARFEAWLASDEAAKLQAWVRAKLEFSGSPRTKEEFLEKEEKEKSSL